MASIAAVPAPGPTLDVGMTKLISNDLDRMSQTRFRFVGFAADQKAAATIALLAECFEKLRSFPGSWRHDRLA